MTARPSPPGEEERAAAPTWRLQRGSSGEEVIRRFRQRTEATRERDVYRHLQPWTAIYRPTALARSPFPRELSQPMPTPEPCADTALTAFAQLAALRLQARRCLVTLLSSHVEYVLAEATRSMSLQYEMVDDPKDAPWIGTCSFVRDDGINTSALEGWRKARRLRELPTDSEHYYGESISPHWCIINDLRGHERYSVRAFVQRALWARFYVSIPLRGAQGSVLGSITIIDDKPRYGISASEMIFIEDIADTVTEHLHATVTREVRQRSEKQIRGLGLFNSGKDSLREWWTEQDESRTANIGRYARRNLNATERQARQDEEFGVRESPMDQVARATKRGMATDQGYSSSATRESLAGSAGRRSAQTAVQDFDQRPDGDVHKQPSFMVKNSDDDGSKDRKKPTGPVRRGQTAVNKKRGAHGAFDLPSAVERTYARGTNLIREALGADGVLCVDASLVSTLRRFDSEGVAMDPTTTTSSEMDARKHSQSLSDTENSDSSFVANMPTCKLQSFSTRSRSSATGSSAAAHRFALPEATLLRLIKRHPKGHIFNYGENGGMYSSSGEDGTTSGSNEDAKIPPRILRWLKDGQRLGQGLPGARTVAFYPLWDETHERWRSCLFVWSTSPLRFFDQAEDLTYLSAWGHSLVAELSRLETIAADRAKGTFIGSVSHELRSPLHGVLAGVELLMETDLTAFQQEMAHTISSAGRTLLDTVNHILDYSKISNFTRAQRKERVTADSARHEAALEGNQNELGVTYDVDLARLTEEIVESVVSAHRFHHLSKFSGQSQAYDDSGSGAGQPPSYTLARRTLGAEDLTISVNIAWRENWAVKLQPGGWTRIVTNLVGNALKYTSKGSITIRLEVEERTVEEAAGEGINHCPVQLSILDTGIGMSKQFLSNDLYTPFMQEDSHSTGTGLGLSIVRQIAKEMHADLDFASEHGKGTLAKVRFDALIVASPPQGVPADAGQVAKPIRTDLGIRRFHLLTLHDSDTDPDTAYLHVSKVGRSVLELAAKWLACETTYGPNVHSTAEDTPIAYAITEQDLIGCLQRRRDPPFAVLSRMSEKRMRIIVLAGSIRSTSLGALPELEGLRIVFAHQPIGPRRLIRAISMEEDAASTPARSQPTNSVLRPSSASDHRPRTPELGHVTRVTSSGRDVSAWPNGSAESTKSKILALNEGDEKTSPNNNHPQRPTLRPRLTRRGTSRSALSPRTLSETSEVLDSPSLHDANMHEPRARDTIMLVEDNSVNMKLLMALMRKLKLPYQCATNGREALDAYRSSPTKYVIILMDMSMPVMDGFTSTAKIREAERKHHWARTTIVALTGVTSVEEIERAFDCGIDQYFAKPVKMAELRDLVDRARKSPDGNEVG